ncbi:hypothetical protein LIA77_07882 [Sarocladium implicatum]|nr:hypothetical protein LIA77_07882 [Sarocladium implicatum]
MTRGLSHDPRLLISEIHLRPGHHTDLIPLLRTRQCGFAYRVFMQGAGRHRAILLVQFGCVGLEMWHKQGPGFWRMLWLGRQKPSPARWKKQGQAKSTAARLWLDEGACAGLRSVHQVVSGRQCKLMDAQIHLTGSADRRRN